MTVRAHGSETAPHGAHERLLTVSDLMALSAAGAFGELEHVELVDGRLVMTPVDGTPHSLGMNSVMEAIIGPVLTDPALKAHWACVANPTLEISNTRALAPDYAVVRRAALQRDTLMTAPDYALAVQVAVSSLAYDDGDKKRLYAQAGLQELWVVRMTKGDVRICREPATDGAWSEERLAKPGETVSPLFAPDVDIPVSALLGRA